MNHDVLNPLQRDVANDLIEWRDSGAPVESVVLSIQRMILGDMRYVMGQEKPAEDSHGHE